MISNKELLNEAHEGLTLDDVTHQQMIKITKIIKNNHSPLSFLDIAAVSSSHSALILV